MGFDDMSFLRSIKRFVIALLARIQNIFLNSAPIVVVGCYDIKYSCYKRSALDAHIIKKGILPEYLCTTSNLKLPKQSVIFDVGANVGYVSFVLAKKYAELGSVHAFEPDLSNIKQFKRNLALNSIDNLYLHEYALQDRDDIDALKFNIRRLIDGDFNENRGISTIANIGLGKVGEVEVLASTIDRQVEKLNLKRLDLIKIDVEGVESLVIKGGLGAIQKFHPIIQYEFSRVLDNLSRSNNAIESFGLIKSLGYKQFAIKNEVELVPLDDIDIQMSDTNVLCFPE